VSVVITKRWLLISATVLLAVAIPKERDVVWVPAPPTSELRMGSSAQTYRWATVTQEQAEAQDPEAWKAERNVIRWNQWILLLPHVKGNDAFVRIRQEQAASWTPRLRYLSGSTKERLTAQTIANPREQMEQCQMPVPEQARKK
jgi:hypothetical protein